MVHPSGTTTSIGSTPQMVANSPVKSTPTKSIVATPLNPGQAIPPGTTVFMSGGKTYCIPKATMTAATSQQQQPQPTTVMQAQPVAQTISTPATPTLPVNPVPQQQLTSPQQQSQPQLQQRQQSTSTIGTVQTQNNAGQKQMVEVKVSRIKYSLYIGNLNSTNIC